MKKYGSWASALALSALLVGCGQQTETAQPTQQTTEQTPETAHKHEHKHEENKGVAQGYFEDSDVKDRTLADWEGDWQSIYPLLIDGSLDEVFEHKAAHDSSKTPEEFKAYYDAGYQTTTERITIEGDTVTFYDHGHAHAGKFAYDGYEILTYDNGNRGVRYIFKQLGDEAAVPKFIQFSDHIIAPEKSGHFHLYWGDDRAALLEEVTHWPTYFPSAMTKEDIVHDMLHH